MKTTHKKSEATGEMVFDCYIFMNKQNLKDSYGHLSYNKRSQSGKTKQIFYIEKWIIDNNLRSYEKCDAIPPPIVCPPTVYNTWTHSPFHGQDITPESPLWREDAIELFTNHMDILCDHNSRASVYVMKWLAQYIQNPSVKTTHVCITGEQGTGKTLGFSVYKKIIAGGAYETTSPEEHVWGKYNGQLLDKNFIIISETNKSNGFGADGKIKALITDSPVTIRQLYCKPIEVASHHRFLTLTNHPDPIKMEKSDRRNLVIKCSSEKIGDREYFSNFAKKFEDRNYLLTLYSYLNALDIDGWEFRLDPKDPITEYQRTLMTEYNRDPLEDFLEWWVGRQVRYDSAIKEGENQGCVVAYGAAMLADFKTYKETNGGKYEVSGAGDLVKKLALNLSLPDGAITKGKVTKHGKSKIYNIDILKKHYKISLVSTPMAAGGSSHADNFDDGNYHDSQDIFIGDDDDDLSFPSRDGRRSSSLLSMRSLSSPLQDADDEIVTATAVATATPTMPIWSDNEDEDEDDEGIDTNLIAPVARLQMPPLTYANVANEPPDVTYEDAEEHDEDEEMEEYGQPSDYESDEGDDCDEPTTASAFTIKDANGRIINLQNRTNK
jgi:hypothetical protein